MTRGISTRQLFVGVGILSTLAWATLGAQQSNSPLDAATPLRFPSALPACGIYPALGRLAVTSRVAIGFEVTTACGLEVPSIDVSHANRSSAPMTVRQVLDQLVALSPNYRWFEMNGVAVVRPAESWTDPSNPLNTLIEPFRVDDGTVGDALALMLAAPPDHGSLSNRRFSMTFSGGTILDALNALVRARQGVVWHVVPVAGPTSSSGENRWLRVTIQAFDSGDSTIGKRTSGAESRMIRVDHFQ